MSRTRRQKEEERLCFLLLQLEIALENGYEFQQRRIERLIEGIEAELGGGGESSE